MQWNMQYIYKNHTCQSTLFITYTCRLQVNVHISLQCRLNILKMWLNHTLPKDSLEVRPIKEG